MNKYKIKCGDNIEVMRKIPDNSIDAIITDPPYGLSFMNKKWDYDVPSVQFWMEVFRVLKPGGHILSFGGTRTYHRMVVNMEDAGFEIRDQIMWLYGSGFPKSHNIGKAVDKIEGNEREYIGMEKGAGTNKFTDGVNGLKPEYENTKGSSPYEGWGTALKPANEPICLARKPLSEKSVAENVLKWGTGGINIDGCRVGTEIIETNMKNTKGGLYNLGNQDRTNEVQNTFNEGRFPANLILECCCDEVIKGEKGEIKSNTREAGNSFNNYDDKKGKVVSRIENYGDKGDIHTNPECPCFQLDSQSGISKPSKGRTGIKGGSPIHQSKMRVDVEGNWPADNGGGASRFFYQAKVSKKERNLGLDGFEAKETRVTNMTSLGTQTTIDKRKNDDGSFDAPRQKNNHPTVKPVQLMAYLCRLITPKNGIVLDPFMGSGSTGVAALLEGFRFCGMEMDKDYFKIAESRIENYEQYREFLKK